MKKEERDLESENSKKEEIQKVKIRERNPTENKNVKEEGREPEDETSKKEEGENKVPSEVVYVELKKPTLKEILYG